MDLCKSRAITWELRSNPSQPRAITWDLRMDPWMWITDP